MKKILVFIFAFSFLMLTQVLPELLSGLLKFNQKEWKNKK